MGTKKLMYNGSMPMFSGRGYPLVPGYEAAGTVGCENLPLSPMMGKADATPSRLLEAVTWNDDARTELDRLVDKEPVLVRISAAKRLRDAARLYEAQAA